jgi:hypothetical protein
MKHRGLLLSNKSGYSNITSNEKLLKNSLSKIIYIPSSIKLTFFWRMGYFCLFNSFRFSFSFWSAQLNRAWDITNLTVFVS